MFGDKSPKLQYHTPPLKPASASHKNKNASNFAKSCNKSKTLAVTFAVLDSLSSTNSMFKYFMDAFLYCTDSDELHDKMMTPEVITAITLEALFLVGFAVLAAKFEKEKTDKTEAYKQFIINAWPFFRDMFKGLKNAYKGWRSTVQALTLLGCHDVKYLIHPLGIALGILAAINRIILRYSKKKYTEKEKQYSELLIEIRKTSAFDKTQLSKLQAIDDKNHGLKVKAFYSLALVTTAINGILDSLYLYVGVLGLAVLAHPIFVVMACLSLIYCLSVVATRICREYYDQMAFSRLQLTCELELRHKELDLLYSQFLELNAIPNKSLQDYELLIKQKNALQITLQHYVKARDALQKQLSGNFLLSLSEGIDRGLYAYTAFISIIFFIAAMFTISSTVFPAALMIAVISAGAALILAFTIHALVTYYAGLKKIETADKTPFNNLLTMNRNLDSTAKTLLLTQEQWEAALKNSSPITPPSQPPFRGWLEVIRSFFAGLEKGRKFTDFAGNAAQIPDAQGCHYHNTPALFVFDGINALLFAFGFCLRAIGKELSSSKNAANTNTEPNTQSTLSKPPKTNNTTTAAIPQYYTPQFFNSTLASSVHLNSSTTLDLA